MKSDFFVVNVKEMLEEGGEDVLKRVILDFACHVNPDVQRFLREQAIEFCKRKQSVTYLVLEKASKKLVGYFTLAIKAISVNADLFSHTMRRKIERVSEVNRQTGEYLLAAYLIA